MIENPSGVVRRLLMDFSFNYELRGYIRCKEPTGAFEAHVGSMFASDYSPPIVIFGEDVDNPVLFSAIT
ncbi:hypothetical protein L3i20_v228640 [Paenibacillus sp. L3-i20]|nr:hypothetical protein L3i20_v228640 [Paenibacillus sp. L3-i20]